MNHHSTPAAADQAAAGVEGSRQQEVGSSDAAVQRVVIVV
jgi:hypothetical protein